MRTILIGAGTLAEALIPLLDGPIVAVTATPTRHPALRARGALPTVEVPSTTASDRVVLMVPGSAGQAAAIASLRGERPGRAVLVGTIGIHAPYVGVVRPDSPPGAGPRATDAVHAEAVFRAWCPGGVVLRCGGLWREGRGPAAAFERKGSAPEGPPDAPLPLIHYDEAARAIAALLLHPAPPAVVLGVTASTTREAFYAGLAASLGLPVPAFTAPLGATARFEDPELATLIGAAG